jgi:O-succinylbenzoic acid--CoA ligase
LDAAGEILIRGDTVAPAALADDGWLHSGDLGSFDGAGRLRIVGRRSETIVTGGDNVAPTEVEAALLEHPAVADAGVFAVSDPEWGEAVHAAVVLRPGTHVAGEELRGHCAERLARYKVPKLIVAVPELPRSPAGKLLRRELPARGL